jgi:hypothetical protein
MSLVVENEAGGGALVAEKGTDPHKSLSELVLTVSILATAPILVRSELEPG